MDRFTAEHEQHWREHGYVVVENFLTPDELAAARENYYEHFPTWDEYAAKPMRYKHLVGPLALLEAPFNGLAINLLAVSEGIVGVAERLIGTTDLHLCQSIIWAKYAGTADFDQTLHVDYENNSLLVPSEEDPYMHVPMIIYLEDVTLDTSPTHIVSKQHTRDLNLWPPEFPREQFPELYEKEVPVVVPAGSAYIHTVSTVHRGSAFKGKTGMRSSMHLVFTAQAHRWMGWRNWPVWSRQNEAWRAYFEAMTPRQRNLFGVPLPGHDFWTEKTIDLMGQRYPKMDVKPYLEALEGRTAG